MIQLDSRRREPRQNAETTPAGRPAHRIRKLPQEGPPCGSSPHDSDLLRSLTLLLAIARATVNRRCTGWQAHDRDDLVQTSALKLLEIVKKRDPPHHYSAAYLSRLARSVVIDEIRRRCRRREVPTAPSDTSTPCSGPNPEQIARVSGLLDSLERSLSRLSPDRRSAVLLTLRGYSIAEVSARLGGSKKRAENLVARGRADLRNLLRDCAP